MCRKRWVVLQEIQCCQSTQAAAPEYQRQRRVILVETQRVGHVVPPGVETGVLEFSRAFACSEEVQQGTVEPVCGEPPRLFSHCRSATIHLLRKRRQIEDASPGSPFGLESYVKC